MKGKRILLAAAFLLTAALALGATSAFADTLPENACLCVNGTATVTAPADLCSFSGCIRTLGDDLGSAAQKAEDAALAVFECFKEYGDAHETYSCAEPMYGQNGFTACKYFLFTTERIGDLAAMRKALTEAGLTSLDGCCYGLKDDSALRSQALNAAIADARAKAEALGCGGELMRVEEQCCCPCGPQSGAQDACVCITVSVRAVFFTPKERENSR